MVIQSCAKVNASAKVVPDHDIKVCDIALFIKHESTITSKYQYGMIHEVLPSWNGIIRKVVVKYRNDQENVGTFTTRAVQKLVLIHPVDGYSKWTKHHGKIREKGDCCLHEAKSK